MDVVDGQVCYLQEGVVRAGWEGKQSGWSLQ